MALALTPATVSAKSHTRLLWKGFDKRKKWVLAGDTVSFYYKTTKDGYRNVLKDTVVVTDKRGKPVQRGDHGLKPTLRTATTRLPGSRRERNG